jgi:hypothetical protein
MLRKEDLFDDQPDDGDYYAAENVYSKVGRRKKKRRRRHDRDDGPRCIIL